MWKRWTKKQTLRTCSSGAHSGHLMPAAVQGASQTGHRLPRDSTQGTALCQREQLVQKPGGQHAGGEEPSET